MLGDIDAAPNIAVKNLDIAKKFYVRHTRIEAGRC